MALQWQAVVDKITRHYDAALMWLMAVCLAGSVGWIIVDASTTESVGTFNERLTAIGVKIQSQSKSPQSVAGSFQSVFDKVENYLQVRTSNDRMIFAKYKDPVVKGPVVISPPQPVQTAPKDVPESDHPQFVLTKTEQEPLPLVWSGELRSEKGLVLYQINTPVGTHFLDEEGEIDGYKIMALENGKLKIQKIIDHEVLYLEYKKQSMEKEFFAEILDTKNQKTQTLRVGNAIGAYTVVEITDSLARLKDQSLGQTLVLELEKPSSSKAPAPTEVSP